MSSTPARLITGLLAALAVALGAGVPAAAQPAPYPPAGAPPYAATPPTAGALYRDGQTARFLLGGEWLYRADPADAGLQAGWGADAAGTAGWAPVTVPNADNADDLSSASMAGYVGWYRRDFRLPGPRGRFWVIRFESVNYRAQVWLNGRLIGSHAGGYVPFELDLAGLRRGVNRLIVRVDGRRSQRDVPPGAYGGTPYIGGWWNFGGILREVYLREVDRVDIAQVQVRPVVRCAPVCGGATITEQALLRNVTGRPQRVHLRGVFGGAFIDFGAHVVAPRATLTVSAGARLAHPHLWAPGNPYLYRATLTLSGPRGERLGAFVTYAGIRSVAVAGGRLLLNGLPVSLRGVGLQEQAAGEGAALAPADYGRLMGWVLGLHATLIRAHYPLDQQLLEMADRDGVLVWSEVPVYQESSDALSDPAWQAVAASMLQTSILTNRNHPSVLLWSVGNELATPADPAEAAYVERAAALARSLDPTRPVGMAVSAWPGSGCQAAYAPLDVVGFNDYFGWYDAGSSATADRDGLGPFLDEFRGCYPGKALFVSEFGFEANREGPVEERGTYAFQLDSALYHLGVFAQKPWLAGAVYWALQDFVCRPGWNGGNPVSDPPFFHKGLVDLQGDPKPAYAAVAATYAATVQVGAARDRR
jgi:beta-glucuronidase